MLHDFFTTKCLLFLKLMRVHQPIGYFLLLWPTLCGLWLSNRGMPNFIILMIFILGVFFMRSAGCIINDCVDYKIDSLVRRTKERPLSSGYVSKQEALILLIILLFISAILVCMLNYITICLSVVGLFLCVVYPYLKKYIYFPQIVLGILFSWPILMGFTASNCCINYRAWLFFVTNVIWVVLYDTEYAMVDCEDDKVIGIKSLAVLFLNLDKFLISILQFFIMMFLWIFGYIEKCFGVFYFFSLFIVSILFLWQQKLIRYNNKLGYFKAFLSNNYVGMVIFFGIALSYL